MSLNLVAVKITRRGSFPQEEGGMASRYLAKRIILELTRSRRVLGLWVLFPLSMLLLFGWVRSEEMGGLGPAFGFTAPGILIGAALFFSCLGGPVSIIVGERERGTLRRLRASPMNGGQYLAGLTLAHLVIALGQAVLVYGITYLVGGHFEGSVAGGFCILALCIGAYVSAGFVIGARFASGTEDINGTVAGIGVPLLVLGGTFFPVDSLPPALYTATQLNPVFHMNRAFTAVARGDMGMMEAWPNVVLLVLFAACAAWMGGRAFNRALMAEPTG
jgi:ABC-2 type transport system permease protein